MGSTASRGHDPADRGDPLGGNRSTGSEGVEGVDRVGRPGVAMRSHPSVRSDPLEGCDRVGVRGW